MFYRNGVIVNIMNDFHKIYGLVGKSLGHSFSKDYFTDFFFRNNLNCSYQNIEIEIIEDLIPFVKENKKLMGFNVTIPYKESVISHLDDIDDIAETVGSVNTVKVEKDGRLRGFNTDVIGFERLLEDIEEQWNNKYKEALVFGSGGASKAVRFVLNKLRVPYKIVTRNCKSRYDIGYSEINDRGFYPYSLIINTTPVGMFPKVDECLELPYSTIEQHNVFIDLIYNPSETLFLKKAKAFGASTYNGLKMLHEQAKASWEIWNK